MCRINKEDYFIGVFVSTILKSSKGVPALFDATGKNKRVEFTTDIGDFNVYVKYSTGLRNATIRQCIIKHYITLQNIARIFQHKCRS